MKNDILTRLAAGKTYAEIAQELGCSKATISYHAKRAGKPRQHQTRHDWVAIQQHHDAGHGVRACIREFGIAKKSWYDAVKRGSLTERREYIDRDKYDLSKALVSNSTFSRSFVKRRLIDDGVIPNECSECGQPPTWRGKKLVMVLDHINGVNNDNRIENIRLLCPNCNSQTDTFCGKNVRKRIK